MQRIHLHKEFCTSGPSYVSRTVTHGYSKIKKRNTWYRKCTDPGLRLAITLRYLATGDSYHTLMYDFRVAQNTICGIVREVCEAIVYVYSEDVLLTPTEPKQWKAIADQFEAKWQFPHTLGALDGKHVPIRCPKNGGSLYYNYKGYHSIVLMALVDADYKFRWVNIGAQGEFSDAQIWNQSDLKQAIERGLMGLPTPTPFPGDDKPLGYYIIADDAFGMRTWLMKPFSRRCLMKREFSTIGYLEVEELLKMRLVFLQIDSDVYFQS